MEKEEEIYDYLRKNHTGKDNAVHSCDLEDLFGLSGRGIRRKVSSLRQNGYPVCSDRTGYYCAQTQREINDTVARLNEFVTKLANARTGLLGAEVCREEGPVIEITIKVI